MKAIHKAIKDELALAYDVESIAFSADSGTLHPMPAVGGRWPTGNIVLMRYHDPTFFVGLKNAATVIKAKKKLIKITYCDTKAQFMSQMPWIKVADPTFDEPICCKEIPYADPEFLSKLLAEIVGEIEKTNAAVVD